MWPSSQSRSPGGCVRIATTEPGFHVYSGQLLASSGTGASGRRLGPHAGLCLWNSALPGFAQQSAFPSVTLRPQQRYVWTTTWQFVVEEMAASLHGPGYPVHVPSNSVERGRSERSRLSPSPVAAYRVGFTQRAMGVRARSRRPNGAIPATSRGPSKSTCPSRQRRPRAASATPGFSGPAGIGGRRVTCRRTRWDGGCSTSARSITRRPSGSTASARRARRAATRRSPFDITDSHVIDRCEIVVRAEDDPARSGEAAREAGLAAGAAFHLVSADHRHLANGLARERAGDAHRARCLHAEPGAVGDRRRSLARGRAPRHRLRLGVKLRSGDTLLGRRHLSVINGEVHRGIALSDPGIDDSRNELLWSPDAPNLIDVRARALGRARASCSIEVSRIRHCGRPRCRAIASCSTDVPISFAWCSTRATGRRAGSRRPTMRRLTHGTWSSPRAMGFNGVRKHQKIEDPRYLYWADALGLAVWEEMPSAYRFTSAVGRAAVAGVDRRHRSATTAIPASSRGCRSTSRGACRTCPTTPASGTTCRRSIT